MEHRPLLFLQPPALPTTNDPCAYGCVCAQLCMVYLHLCMRPNAHVSMFIYASMHNCVCVCVRLQGLRGRQMLLLSEHNELLIGR